MNVVLVAALSGTLGALIALAGTLVTESFRQRGEFRQWRLDKLLELYASMLEVSREAKRNAHEARQGDAQLSEEYVNRFRSLLTKAELLASQYTIDRMWDLNDAIHDDYHSAETHIMRKTDPNFTTHHGHDSPWTSLEDWNRRREAMQNSFRRDLGLPTARFLHRTTADPADGA